MHDSDGSEPGHFQSCVLSFVLNLRENENCSARLLFDSHNVRQARDRFDSVRTKIKPKQFFLAIIAIVRQQLP